MHWFTFFLKWGDEFHLKSLFSSNPLLREQQRNITPCAGSWSYIISLHQCYIITNGIRPDVNWSADICHRGGHRVHLGQILWHHCCNDSPGIRHPDIGGWLFSPLRWQSKMLHLRGMTLCGRQNHIIAGIWHICAEWNQSEVRFREVDRLNFGIFQ